MINDNIDVELQKMGYTIDSPQDDSLVQIKIPYLSSPKLNKLKYEHIALLICNRLNIQFVEITETLNKCTFEYEYYIVCNIRTRYKDIILQRADDIIHGMTALSTKLRN